MDFTDAGAFLWSHYHKNWIDVCTFLVAVIFAAWKWLRTPSPRKLRSLGRHVMDGSAVFPLMMLTIAVLSRHAIDGLLSASRPTLSIAGFFSLLAVLEDDSQIDVDKKSN
jgi:hypothetical protein